MVHRSLVSVFLSFSYSSTVRRTTSKWSSYARVSKWYPLTKRKETSSCAPQRGWRKSTTHAMLEVFRAVEGSILIVGVVCVRFLRDSGVEAAPHWVQPSDGGVQHFSHLPCAVQKTKDHRRTHHGRYARSLKTTISRSAKDPQVLPRAVKRLRA